MSIIRGEFVQLTQDEGSLMPLLGLGCWQSKPGEVEPAIREALRCGYRHFDTAFMYANEKEVGTAIRDMMEELGIARDKIFVVTKLPMTGMRPELVEEYLRKSLANLNLTYVDLYLVHCPIGLQPTGEEVFPRDDEGNMLLDYDTDLVALWKEMEAMVERGLARHVGVSNYNEKQLRRTLASASIPPVVNQVELHVYFQQAELREFCKENGIALTAYASLGSPGTDHIKIPRLLQDPVVQLIASYRGVSPAQVLLRFWVQQGVAVIPKSVTLQRIRANARIFSWSLSDLEMTALRSLDKGAPGRGFIISSWPGADRHPECPF